MLNKLFFPPRFPLNDDLVYLNEIVFVNFYIVVVLCNIRTLSNMNYIIIAIETHMCTYSIYAHMQKPMSRVRVYECPRVQGKDLWKLLNECSCSQEKVQNFLDLQFSNLSFWLKDPGISYDDSFVHVHRVHYISCAYSVRLEVVFMVIEKPKRPQH